MTALVSAHSTFLLDQPSIPSHTPGILLNTRSHSSPLHAREPRQPSSVSAPHTLHSPSPPPSLDPGGPSRKIRFAPLPAPRRDQLPSVFPESDSDSQLPSLSTQAPSDSSPQPPPSPPLHPDDAPPKSKSRTWGQKLLRPLLLPLLPATTTNPDESYSALFRISSRESTRTNPDLPDESYNGGVPLARRMSTGSRAIPSATEAERSQLYSDGVPLMPVMSDGFASRGRKDGQRMLNGRVYGRRFSPAQSGKKASSDPEFVEWGYGGMGSVTNSQAKSNSGPDWAKLQSNGKVLGASNDIDEQDDGSGMGWVRRRRAQREREEKEREGGEKAAPDHAVPDIAVHSPESNGRDSSPPSCKELDHSKDSEDHHIYRAVSVPAPHHHHVRHHSHHKPGDASGTVTPNSIPSISRANSSSSVPLIRTPSSGSQGETLPPMIESMEDAEMSSGSSVTSRASIDEDDEDQDDDDTERESDDDADDDAEGRITSKGAGVEKISRHKE